jgi:hypothetical protein
MNIPLRKGKNVHCSSSIPDTSGLVRANAESPARSFDQDGPIHLSLFKNAKRTKELVAVDLLD